MPVVFILLAGLLFGLYKLYGVVTGAWGALAGMAAVLAAAAIIAAAVALLVQRHRALHGRRINGERLLQISGDWGRLLVNADGRRAQLRLNGQDVDFIFGDIAGVAPSADPQSPGLVLQLRPTPGREWRIPMPNRRQTQRWVKILTLAEQRTL
mgnify:FL=1